MDILSCPVCRRLLPNLRHGERCPYCGSSSTEALVASPIPAPENARALYDMFLKSKPATIVDLAQAINLKPYKHKAWADMTEDERLDYNARFLKWWKAQQEEPS